MDRLEFDHFKWHDYKSRAQFHADVSTVPAIRPALRPVPHPHPTSFDLNPYVAPSYLYLNISHINYWAKEIKRYDGLNH